MLPARHVQEIIHELLNDDMVLEHGQYHVVDLLDALQCLLSTFFETWIICLQGASPAV